MREPEPKKGITNMSFSLKDAMTDCPGLLAVVEQAVKGFHGAMGGWPSSDIVRITVIVSHANGKEREAGHSVGDVSSIGKLIDRTYVEDGH